MILDFKRLDCMGDALRDSMITFKSNTALIEANRKRESARYGYRELKQQAENLAGRLQEAGLVAGDRCAILMSNQSKWIISGLAGIWSGAILVPLDYKLTAPEQLKLLAHSKPGVLIVEYPIWRNLEKLDLSSLAETLILVSEAPDNVDIGVARRFEDEGSYAFSYRARAREDIATIVYTSGTGGTPKGCMLTHHNYLCQAEALSLLFDFREDDRYFSILPTNHAIDFMCGFIMPLILGQQIIHQRTLRPEFLGWTMKRYKVTLMAVVPLILKAFEKKIRTAIDDLPKWKRNVLDGLIAANEFATQKRPKHELSSKLLAPLHAEFGGDLRLIFVGGAFVERETAEFMYKLGFSVVIGYGMTEAGVVLTLNDLSPFRADSVGKAIPGVKVEIRNAEPGGVGEVWVRGETVMLGYLDEPTLTDDVLIDGWLKTGDLGILDGANHLKLVGRQKNMIVTAGGKNVYPEDLETAFNNLSDCEEYCVFATNFVWPQETMTGEELMIVLRSKEKAETKELLAELKRKNRKLADFKRIAGYVFWDEPFPRTASMKLKRGVLASELRETLAKNESYGVLHD